MATSPQTLMSSYRRPGATARINNARRAVTVITRRIHVHLPTASMIVSTVMKTGITFPLEVNARKTAGWTQTVKREALIRADLAAGMKERRCTVVVMPQSLSLMKMRSLIKRMYWLSSFKRTTRRQLTLPRRFSLNIMEIHAVNVATRIPIASKEALNVELVTKSKALMDTIHALILLLPLLLLGIISRKEANVQSIAGWTQTVKRVALIRADLVACTKEPRCTINVMPPSLSKTCDDWAC